MEDSYSVLLCAHVSETISRNKIYIPRDPVANVRDVRPRTSYEGPEGECRYSSNLSLTSVRDGVAWLTPRPGRFTPGEETRYPLYSRTGEPQGRYGRVRNIVPPTGIRYQDLLARS
jgi:hypothetical protein